MYFPIIYLPVIVQRQYDNLCRSVLGAMALGQNRKKHLAGASLRTKEGSEASFIREFAWRLWTLLYCGHPAMGMEQHTDILRIAHEH